MRHLKNLPLWVIGISLALTGIALVALDPLARDEASGGGSPVLSTQRTPPLSPAPNDALSSVELLVDGFAPFPMEETLPARPQDEDRSLLRPFTEGAEIPPSRLVIPTLGIDAPIVEIPITQETWDVSGLTYQIAHLAGTADPGQGSNMVLAGHVTLKAGPGPFLNLARLEPGQLVIVYAGNDAYRYQIVSRGYVRPTEVSVAYPTSTPILTLLTCANWDSERRVYTGRLVVIAEFLEETI